MSIEESIKSKIDSNYPNNSNPNFSNEEFGYILNGGALTGNAPFQDGDRPDDPRTPYQTAFRELSIIQLKEKSYQNLTFNEVRYGVKILDEASEAYKAVVKNLDNAQLGPALEEFTFSQFDTKVSLEVNTMIESGFIATLNKLPIFIEKPRPDGPSVGPTGTNYELFNTLNSDIIDNAIISKSTFEGVREAYQTNNGADIVESSARMPLDPVITLQGNASRITDEFINIAGVATHPLIRVIQNFFQDFSSPRSIIDTRYKNFLLTTVTEGNVVQIERDFKKEVEFAAQEIAANLMYNFEFERRRALVESLRTAGPDATVEDILNAAEAAAIEEVGGLAGEGGITEDLSPEDIEERQRFFEQCVLLASMDEMKTHFDNAIVDEEETKGESDSPESSTTEPSEKIHQPTPYQERFYMVEVPSGRNDRLVNFLNAPSDELVNDFLNLTPDIQAFLTPKLRLYKVYNEGNSLKQIEFIFKNTTDSTNILKEMFKDNDKFFRGSGYGIKNFSLSFNGTTPATAKNDIKADLTLYFQDFADFVTPVDTTEGTFKFVDLIFYDKRNENNPLYGYGNSHPDQYSPAYYRIRADVGWQIPKNQPQFDEACRKRNIDPDNVRNVIEKANKSYYLNMVDHELDFKKDGTVEIKAQYRGYIESVLKGTTMDALTDKKIIQERKNREDQLAAAVRSCTPGELAKIKRIYAAEEQAIIEDLYQRTYERLLDLGKIRSFGVNNDGGFRKEGYFSKQPSIYDNTGAEGAIDDEHAYYFLGDLLYVMLDAVYADNNIAEPIGKTKFILPSIQFENFFEDSGTFSINIAQIPISHRYFSEWWLEHVVKAKKRSYPIMFYLRDLLNNLIADALIDVCLNRNYRKSFNFQTTTVNASGDPLSNKSNHTQPIISLDQSELPFTVSEGTDINDITNYVLIFAAYSTTLPSGTGKYTDDIKNGVYHFHLGQDRGIINDVKFNKVDMSYIREARMQREGVDGLLQLGAVYRASINMFGNTLFYPGMLIYINPFGIGGEEFLPNKQGTIANQLGLGGYHIIEKVNSSIGSGVFKTSIEAMFVYSGDGDTRIQIQGRGSESDEEDVRDPEAKAAECENLVSAIRADYLNTLAGQQTDLAQQATLDTNAENVRRAADRIRQSTDGAVDITFDEAQQETQSSIPTPDTGFNVGLSPEDLIGETEELTEFEKLQQRLQNATGGSQ